jgi:peptidoglycan/LPS O-acetylase OafA/YrhL
MNRPFSIYLDLVRFTAACLVYLWHSNMRPLVNDVLPASQFGHSSVIVFFVLSGFVIAYVTDKKEKTWIEYGASRLSRVYSVVLPTLVLTPLLDAAGRHLYPAMYEYPWDRFTLRLLGSGLMMNETWWVSITFFSNVPYWSIAFESWYYLIFGLTMFVPGPWLGWRGAAVLLACAVVGPKIVLLAPVWWCGVLLYRWTWLQRWSAGFSWAMVVVSITGIWLTHAVGVYEMTAEWTRAWLGDDRVRQLTFARFAIGDYLLGALVFCNFAAVRNVAQQVAVPLLAVERPVRWLAGYTFTLYLLHQPLFLFWMSVVRGDPSGHGFWWIVTGLTAASVVAIGTVTEHRRHPLKRRLQRVLQGMHERWQVRAARA